MSYKKMSVVNPKNTTTENVEKMVQSAALLVTLSNYNISLIFIDEFSMSSRSQKVLRWAEKGKKALVSQYCGATSFMIIIGLSSRQFYAPMIK